MKESLFGKNLTQIQKICQEKKYPGYTAAQICDWLYHRHIYEFAAMTNLPKKIREELSEELGLGVSPFHKEAISQDGTRKYLFEAEKGFVEAAVIPDDERMTLCLSTQVGCKRKCAFCLTGRQGLAGNLSVSEILNQYASLPCRDAITNFVFMGMGEPLDNKDNVFQSLEILTSPTGYAKSPYRITLSTIGVLPELSHFLQKSQCHLAISLHSPFQEERCRLLPAAQEYPLKDLFSLLQQHDFGKQRRLTFEYLVFENYNDTPRHSKELTRLLNGLCCRVNLLHYHSLPNNPLQGAKQETLERFQSYLTSRGIRATIRKSRGEDIGAACGLLSTKALCKKEQLI